MPVYVAGTLYIIPVLGPSAIDVTTAEGPKPEVIYSVRAIIYTGILTTALTSNVVVLTSILIATKRDSFGDTCHQ
jgi:hypothetical protein